MLAHSILLSKIVHVTTIGTVPTALRVRMMTILTSSSPAACIPQLDNMNRDSANPTQGRRRRNQRDRQARATETPEYREARLARRRERYRERRAEETAEQCEARLRRQREIDRGRRAQARSQETAEQREARLALRRQQDRARRTQLSSSY